MFAATLLCANVFASLSKGPLACQGGLIRELQQILQRRRGEESAAIINCAPGTLLILVQ